MIATDNCSNDVKTGYRFHGGVRVRDKILCPYEEELIPRHDAQPADDVEVVQTEAEPWTLTGNFRGIANSWEACVSECVCVWGGWWQGVRERCVKYEV